MSFRLHIFNARNTSEFFIMKKNESVTYVMTPSPICVAKNESVSTARHLINEKIVHYPTSAKRFVRPLEFLLPVSFIRCLLSMATRWLTS